MNLNILKTGLQGMAMGSIDIVPGVSGSTVAVLFGIYERFIAALKNIDLTLLRALFSPVCHGFSAESRKNCVTIWREKDMPWLLNLVAGLGCAIVAASFFIPWLMENYPDITRGFFFGLVLGSTITPLMALKRPKIIECLVILAFGTLCFVLLGQNFEPPANYVEVLAPAGSTLSDVTKQLPCLLPPDGVAALSQNTQFHETYPALSTLPASEVAQLAVPEGMTITLPVIPLYFSFIAGFCAICAMLLPGISGSFILLVLGLYYGALNAAKGTISALVHGHFATDHAIVLGLLALGAIAGMATFSRALTWLFNHQRRLTMAAIVGILLGCLRAVWPFRETHDMTTVNVLPSAEYPHIAGIIVACIVALGLVAFCVVKQYKKSKETQDSECTDSPSETVSPSTANSESPSTADEIAQSSAKT